MHLCTGGHRRWWANIDVQILLPHGTEKVGINYLSSCQNTLLDDFYSDSVATDMLFKQAR